MNTTVFATDTSLKGDLTSCKIESVLKEIKRDSVFSLVETRTYITYDVCTKKILSEYSTPLLTGFSGGLAAVAMIASLVILLLYFNYGD